MNNSRFLDILEEFASPVRSSGHVAFRELVCRFYSPEADDLIVLPE
jgi:hypothetical protein